MVVHHSPRSVQFSCIGDGAAVATGASLRKLDLSLVEANEAGVETIYRRRSTGQPMIARPSAAFRARFRDVPRAQFAAADQEVLSLPDAEVLGARGGAAASRRRATLAGRPRMVGGACGARSSIPMAAAAPGPVDAPASTQLQSSYSANRRVSTATPSSP
ncbi:hypothetical protein BE20_11145 [Sorangium cellulosum]|nr:hypothetical protein BE20_11145 [Sorangium cellulosum]